MHIGILNLTRFGDLVQTSPMLSGLRRRHPDAGIDLIIKSRFREAAGMLCGPDRIVEIDGDALARTLADPASTFIDGFRAVRRIADDLSSTRYDVVYNLTHSRASAVLLSLMQAGRHVGFDMDRCGMRQVETPWLRHMGTVVRARRLNRINLVDVYLGAAGLVGQGERLHVEVPARARAAARERLSGDGPLLAVQLGASSDTKTWGIEAFTATLRHLAEALPALRVVLVGVKDERARADALRARASQIPFVDLIGGTTLPELAGVVERCDALLTGDTGTMHLAGAVATPTCSIFVGLGMPWETGVYAADHVALSSRLSCAPCQHNVVCGHPVCHEDFPPRHVAAILERVVRGASLDDLPALPRASVWRTGFDADGVWEMQPLHPFRAGPDDVLAEAYRAAFLESLAAIPADPARVRERLDRRHGEWRPALPPGLGADLAQLRTQASRAVDLVGEMQRCAGDPGELKRLADSLAACDARIYALGREQPAPGSSRARSRERAREPPRRGAPRAARRQPRRLRPAPRAAANRLERLGSRSASRCRDRRNRMIDLEINDRRRRIEPSTAKELRDLIARDLPAGHLIEQLSVNGRARDPEELEVMDLGGLASIAIRSSSPQQIARGSLDETVDWIGRICNRLEEISAQYRTGAEQEATGNLVEAIDALQVLAGLLSGIRRWVDVPAVHRARFEAQWEEAENSLQAETEALLGELEAGNPVELADRTGSGLPDTLRRFAVLLEQLRA